MKGVRRDVVEIQEPKDENIEKVLVFFKPGCPAVRLGTQEEAALGYADRLTTWRKGGGGPVRVDRRSHAFGGRIVGAGPLAAVMGRKSEKR